jgi:cation/acetate symporter
MATDVYERIRHNAKFNELVARRSRFAWTLSAIVLGVYFTFVFVVAFAPKLLATPLAAGMTTTVAIPIGVGMVVFFWLLTGLYVRRANSDFDVVNKEIVKEAMK